MRSVDVTGLAGTTKGSGRAWGLVLLPLLLLAFSQEGTTQETAAISKSPKAAEASGTARSNGQGAAAKPRPSPVGLITSVSANQEGNNLVVTVGSNSELAYQEFTVDNPSRLVVDFLNAENRVSTLNYHVGAVGVKQLRIRQFQSSDPKIARLVFDLEDNCGEHEIAGTEHGMRITFHPPENAASSAPKSPAPIQASADPGTGSRSKSPAAGRQPASSASGNEHAADAPVVTVPVISDLSASEIPLSALASASQEPLVRAAPPPVKAKPAAERTPDRPVSRSPLLSMNHLSGKFTGQPLSIDLVNFPLVDFFRLLAKEGGINIVVDPAIQGTYSIMVDSVPWDEIFETTLLNNGLEKEVTGNLVRIVTRKTMQAEAKEEEDLKKANLLAADVETRVRRLNYAKVSTMQAAVKDQMTVRGTIVPDERTASLVITDVPSSLDKVAELIDKLDTPEPQVEIEARIVSATRDFARDIGIQFGFVQGNLERITVGGPNTFGTIGGTRPSATPTNTYSAGNSSTGRGATESSSTQSGGVSAGPNSANNPGNFNVNLPSQKPFGGMGISVGNIFDTFLLDAAITAGESKGQAKLISQPKLTTQNNSAGTITQGLRFPVQVIANNTVSVQFQNAALTLTVTPQITSEGNILLDLKIENDTPDFARQVAGIPSIRTSESTSRVLVTDGGTTVIGGILIDNEQTQEDRVPGLASLPIFGNLFRRSSLTRSTQEVLFFVTPRIVR
jgi:type IV pilus assembly protein PilQ